MGVWPGAATGDCFDCIATLAFLAGCTQRIQLLTSVVVVPHRPAVLAAKLFTTADVLSGGRVIAGIGAGWMREEFAALGTPAVRRARRSDRRIPGRPGGRCGPSDGRRTHGKYAKFADVLFSPKPASQPRLPIWVGGESAPALRRTVQVRRRLVSGVEQPENPPQHARAPARRASNNCIARRSSAGRDPSSIDVALPVVCPAHVDYRAKSRAVAVVQRQLG